MNWIEKVIEACENKNIPFEDLTARMMYNFGLSRRDAREEVKAVAIVNEWDIEKGTLIKR